LISSQCAAAAAGGYRQPAVKRQQQQQEGMDLLQLQQQEPTGFAPGAAAWSLELGEADGIMGFVSSIRTHSSWGGICRMTPSRFISLWGGRR